MLQKHRLVQDLLEIIAQTVRTGFRRHISLPHVAVSSPRFRVPNYSLAREVVFLDQCHHKGRERGYLHEAFAYFGADVVQNGDRDRDEPHRDAGCAVIQ